VLATWSSPGPTVVGFAPTKRTVEIPGSEAGTVSSQDSFEFSDVMEPKPIEKRALGRHKEGDDRWTAGCDDMARAPVPAFHQCGEQTRGIVRTRQTTGSIVVSLRNTYAKSRAWFWVY
jgi:hypothetical protein